MALMVAGAGVVNNPHGPGRIVAIGGGAVFALLFLHAWWRSVRRIVVMEIVVEGFVIHDPAGVLPMVHWEEMSEVRIHATLEHPLVAIRLANPRDMRARMALLPRLFVGLWWPLQRYHLTVQLDHLDDQVAAVSAAARRHGVPVRSELV